MIPAGYLYKQVAAWPDGFGPEHVAEIWSVSGCISREFANVAWYGRNVLGFFDTPEAMRPFAAAEGVDLTGMRLFYYEMFPEAYDEKRHAWVPVAFDAGALHVRVPEQRVLAGFDIATFSLGNIPECSPLSCNGLAQQVAVDAHCLMADLDAARAALDSGLFDNAEPGPHRIFAVYTLP